MQLHIHDEISMLHAEQPSKLNENAFKIIYRDDIFSRESGTSSTNIAIKAKISISLWSYFITVFDESCFLPTLVQFEGISHFSTAS